MRPHGLMFHHFHGHGHVPSQGSISADELREILSFAGLRNILPAHEFLDRALRGTLRPADRCLTFDDNLRCQFDIALPVLRELKLSAFWFVYTSVLQGNIERLEIYRQFRMTQFPGVEDFYAAFFVAADESPHGQRIDEALRTFRPAMYLRAFPFYTDGDRRFRFVRDEVLGPDRYAEVMDQMLRDAGFDVRAVARGLWMDDDCLGQLSGEGHVVGLHSHTHPTRLARLSPEDQWYEYRENANYLRVLLGQNPVAMSHPCNSYNTDTLQVLSDLGIRLGFRSNLAEPTWSMLEHPREDHSNILRDMRLAA